MQEIIDFDPVEFELRKFSSFVEKTNRYVLNKEKIIRGEKIEHVSEPKGSKSLTAKDEERREEQRISDLRTIEQDPYQQKERLNKQLIKNHSFRNFLRAHEKMVEESF